MRQRIAVVADHSSLSMGQRHGASKPFPDAVVAHDRQVAVADRSKAAAKNDHDHRIGSLATDRDVRFFRGISNWSPTGPSSRSFEAKSLHANRATSKRVLVRHGQEVGQGALLAEMLKRRGSRPDIAKSPVIYRQLASDFGLNSTSTVADVEAAPGRSQPLGRRNPGLGKRDRQPRSAADALPRKEKRT